MSNFKYTQSINISSDIRAGQYGYQKFTLIVKTFKRNMTRVSIQLTRNCTGPIVYITLLLKRYEAMVVH